jgi:DNA (cytosine-5)-methyltransferase 1
VEPVVHVEREAHAAAVLVARMAEAAIPPAPVWDDITTFDAREWRGIVDLVAGGTPCQDLSVAGKRAGLDGARSRLFFEHVRIAVECEAPFFFWENVAGATRALPAVCAYLEERGYRGAWTVVRASDVGAPHQRARVFLLAYSESFGRLQGRAEPAGLCRGRDAPQRCGPMGED